MKFIAANENILVLERVFNVLKRYAKADTLQAGLDMGGIEGVSGTLERLAQYSADVLEK